MTTPRKSVAVTGSSGYVGSTLLRHLEEYGAFDKLVAIDNRPLPFPVHNVFVYRRDVTESIQDALVDNNVSTLVHLAYVGRQGRNQERSMKSGIATWRRSRMFWSAASALGCNTSSISVPTRSTARGRITPYPSPSGHRCVRRPILHWGMTSCLPSRRFKSLPIRLAIPK